MAVAPGLFAALAPGSGDPRDCRLRGDDGSLVDRHLLFFPALALAATTAGFVLLGDAVRDVLDPHDSTSRA